MTINRNNLVITIKIHTVQRKRFLVLQETAIKVGSHRIGKGRILNGIQET